MKHLAKVADRHRIAAALVMLVMWAVLEYVLQWHNASKVVEVLGLSPFADRAIGIFLGET